MSPKFILLGAAGYVAPRHMAAIKAVGGELIAAVDPHDSVGVLDRYFPECRFYRNYLDIPEELTRYADYAVICTPNYLHGVAAWWALDNGMDAIIEKPATISVKKLDELLEIERATGKRINCILQMRLHHDADLLLAFADMIQGSPVVDIEYHTPRGPWYAQSWKARKDLSGGILFNIGIHLIDLAILAFGTPVKDFLPPFIVNEHGALGEIRLERADLFVNLSIATEKRVRRFKVGSAEFDFTNGFDELHTESYRRILAGRGFGLEEARAAIELCERLSNAA
jgi:UDP-N-acetyl-2-amino-2-deoxyglucuronate dehydrogenase